MPEPKIIAYKFKELAAILVRERSIREGHWGIYIKFGIQAGNFGPSETELLPGAFVPILELGLQQFDSPNALTVDAATVWNEAPPKAK